LQALQLFLHGELARGCRDGSQVAERLALRLLPLQTGYAWTPAHEGSKVAVAVRGWQDEPVVADRRMGREHHTGRVE